MAFHVICIYSAAMPRRVLNHFKKHDPTLYAAIHAFNGELRDGPEIKKDFFASLCRTIVGQQLSGKAADAIWKKFCALFPHNKPTAKHILAFSDMTLRESGLSFAKIRALRDLSERVSTRALKLSTLRSVPHTHAREKLQEVRGIGPWSSEMFLMFALGHEDVFSTGDLGLQKGIQKIYGLDALPDTETILRLSECWSPYRTYAACVIWSILDNR